MRASTCQQSRLVAFLNEELSGKEERELVHHLNRCQECQLQIEQLAANGESWRNAGELLRGQTTSQTDAEQNGMQSIRFILEALAPTDDAEMLGRLGGYEVSGVIGSGGMGVVLKATDRALDRIVAIKVMAPHLANKGSARTRFAREAKAAAAVLHPNVIAIYSVACDSAFPYLVMPYIRGQSLQKRLDANGAMALADVLRIGTQIAAGLAAAHEQGLVHRDIKPANVLLDEGVERVTITDFGLARLVDDGSETQSGVIAGTPQYMSPEQARGEVVDTRSDLFSLGSVLYALCTGHAPFRAQTSYGVLHRIAHDTARPIQQINSEIPHWLCNLIERLHAKAREDRWQSAEEVRGLLKTCLAHIEQPDKQSLPKVLQRRSGHSALTRHRVSMVACSALGIITLVVWLCGFPRNGDSADETRRSLRTTNAASVLPEPNTRWVDPVQPSLIELKKRVMKADLDSREPFATGPETSNQLGQEP